MRDHARLCHATRSPRGTDSSCPRKDGKRRGRRSNRSNVGSRCAFALPLPQSRALRLASHRRPDRRGPQNAAPAERRLLCRADEGHARAHRFHLSSPSQLLCGLCFGAQGHLGAAAPRSHLRLVASDWRPAAVANRWYGNCLGNFSRRPISLSKHPASMRNTATTTPPSLTRSPAADQRPSTSPTTASMSPSCATAKSSRRCLSSTPLPSSRLPSTPCVPLRSRSTVQTRCLPGPRCPLRRGRGPVPGKTLFQVELKANGRLEYEIRPTT